MAENLVGNQPGGNYTLIATPATFQFNPNTTFTANSDIQVTGSGGFNDTVFLTVAPCTFMGGCSDFTASFLDTSGCTSSLAVDSTNTVNDISLRMTSSAGCQATGGTAGLQVTVTGKSGGGIIQTAVISIVISSQAVVKCVNDSYCGSGNICVSGYCYSRAPCTGDPDCTSNPPDGYGPCSKCVSAGGTKHCTVPVNPSDPNCSGGVGPAPPPPCQQGSTNCSSTFNCGDANQVPIHYGSTWSGVLQVTPNANATYTATITQQVGCDAITSPVVTPSSVAGTAGSPISFNMSASYGCNQACNGTYCLTITNMSNNKATQCCFGIQCTNNPLFTLEIQTTGFVAAGPCNPSCGTSTAWGSSALCDSSCNGPLSGCGCCPCNASNPNRYCNCCQCGFNLQLRSFGGYSGSITVSGPSALGSPCKTISPGPYNLTPANSPLSVGGGQICPYTAFSAGAHTYGCNYNNGSVGGSCSFSATAGTLGSVATGTEKVLGCLGDYC